MKKHYDFIEIGTSDFDTLIETANDSVVGLTIEPLKYYLDRLPNKKNVKKLQIAIADEDGEIEIFYIPDENISKYSLPWWVRGSNSVGKPHPFTVKEIGKELYDSIVKIDKVPTLSWNTLVEQQDVGSISYLKVDTEGFDHVIMNDYLNMCQLKPELYADTIKFERHPEVSNIEKIDELIKKFKDYHVEISGTDVILKKVKIPRIIHQTFKTQDLPSEIQKVVDDLKSMNPDFEYRFYDDNDCYEFIKKNYNKETLDLYSSINESYGACKADFFRYLLMYKVGGVYLDIKSTTTRPLRETILPTDEYLLTHWVGKDWSELLNYYHGEFQNWHIICVPGHPFLKETIERVKKNIKSYNGEVGKSAVLHLTGPIPYSQSILVHLDKLRTYSTTSPVREFQVEDEIHLKYLGTKEHHYKYIGVNYSKDEPVILENFLNKKKRKGYVYLVDENYMEIAKASATSIREFSDLPIYVYMLNSDKKVEVENTITIRWDVELPKSDEPLYKIEGNNFYIDRTNSTIYKILIQRINVVKHALENFLQVVAYVDSDSVATPLVDSIFDMYNENENFPYFVEGIYEWMHQGNRGGAESREDLTSTLEEPACQLFNINQYVRQEYRQTGYFVAGQNSIDFLEEWYWYCIHPKVLKNISLYAAYNEETIMNVVTYKHKIFKGLPYIYVNGGLELVDKIYTETEFLGDGIKNYVAPWLRIPEHKSNLLFFHGEKNPTKMLEMIEKIKSHHGEKKTKLLFLAPHLSTGGMPGFLLKRIQLLKKYQPNIEIYVVEFGDYGPAYVVQKNQIKELIDKNKFWTLGENKMELINIIKENNIDIVHVEEMVEGFDSFNQMPYDVMSELYSNDRTWKMVETCHNVWFKHEENKIFYPEAFAFCTPYHKDITFKSVPSYSEVIEFPIENKNVTSEEKIAARRELGFGKDRIHVINVGLWTSGKNQGEGIEIARLLKKTNPEIMFHFIGNQAPNFKDYWGPIMKSVPMNVKIWGERSDIDTFMKAADVFMFNSTWECNPLVLREAISYGLKVLCRNLPQYLDMFTDYISPIEGDINHIKDTLLELINQEEIYTPPSGQEEIFAKNHDQLYSKVLDLPVRQQKFESKFSVIQYYINQPFLEIKGRSANKFHVKFFDEKDICHYENTLPINSWIRLNRQYFTRWTTKIWENDELVYDYTLNYENQRVYISFDSKSLGDSVAWIPYVLEFQNKHKCHVVVSTFWNKLFKPVYPELEFVEPGSVVENIHGMYKLGWFSESDMQPRPPKTIPLQQTATDILGLDFEEIKPNIFYEIKEKPYEGKYVTIATNSTAGCKFWTREGWQELINYLTGVGYKVVNVSKENNPFENQIRLQDTSIENTMNVIHHSEFFIGLSSGLSWLAWGMGKHVVMISNFTTPDHEFQSNCTRIINLDVCNGCWNKLEFTFDKGDWDWCPEHKGTPRHFECHKSITPSMVINQIQKLIK